MLTFNTNIQYCYYISAAYVKCKILQPFIFFLLRFELSLQFVKNLEEYFVLVEYIHKQENKLRREDYDVM